MALPRKIRPEYSTTLTLNGKKVKYMPFTVREEKVLVLAAESKDIEEISNAVVNILNACITTPDIKAETLPIFDLQHLFLKCRSKSAGEKIKIKITDPTDKSDTPYSTTHEINLDKIQVQKTEGHTDLIQLDEHTAVKMNYPGIKYFAEGLNLENIDGTSDTIKDCISQIIVGEDVYNRSDMTEEEVSTWVEDLLSREVELLVDFFKTMPVLKHKITLKNPNTEKTFTVTLEGLQDFF